jgi:formate dehydrogenase subunit delta
MSSSLDRLVMMANQIGKFFTPQRGSDAVAAIADLQKFWDPRMRAAIVADVAAGGSGLDGPVRKAVGRLKEARDGATVEAGG